MAQFWNEVEGPGSLRVKFDVLGVIDPESGFVQRGAAGYGTAGGLYAIEVSFSWAGHPYLEELVLVPKFTVEEFPEHLAAFIDNPAPERNYQNLGIESADLHMIVRRVYDTPGEDGTYSLLVVVDTGVMPGAWSVTFGGPAIYFAECSGRMLLDFVRALREESHVAPAVAFEDVL